MPGTCGGQPPTYLSRTLSPQRAEEAQSGLNSRLLPGFPTRTSPLAKPTQPPAPRAQRPTHTSSLGAGPTWMWQDISESSSSRMVHFISWLSDLTLELRKWIIFMVLLPPGTQ